MSRNLAASIRARLKNVADARKQDYNLVLTHYGLEWLLYRLSISEHAPNFLFKGALLFSLWYDIPQRPTRDADLLGFGPDASTPWSRSSMTSAASPPTTASSSIRSR